MTLLSELFLLAGVVICGGLLIGLILYLFFSKNLTTRLWFWLFPGIGLLIADTYLWALFGGFKNVFLTFIQVPIGISLLIANFLIVGKSLVFRINRIANQLIHGVAQSTSTSAQIANASQSLAEGSSEQAASIEETSASLEEISSMTRQNAEHADKARQLSDETKSTVESCSNAMQEMAAAIGQVNDASQETRKIVKTIDEIAFQTNLLALNAAVEAARAGEAGAGFAVVADEVRNLALRASEAARNTTSQIEDISRKINEAIEMVFKTIDEFSNVDVNTGKVNGLVSDIASASKEQAQGIEQVNTAVAEMDKVVQRNTANAEESASASEEMKVQAEEMKSMVNNLVNLINGKNESTDCRWETASLVGQAKKRIAKEKRNHVAVLSAKVGLPEQIIPLIRNEACSDF